MNIKHDCINPLQQLRSRWH